jgi:hypothetical protein
MSFVGQPDSAASTRQLVAQERTGYLPHQESAGQDNRYEGRTHRQSFVELHELPFAPTTAALTAALAHVAPHTRPEHSSRIVLAEVRPENVQRLCLSIRADERLFQQA